MKEKVEKKSKSKSFLKSVDRSKTKKKDDEKKEEKVVYGYKGYRKRILMTIKVPKKTRGNMDVNFIISAVED